MSTFHSLEEARAYFKEDHFATGNGMQIDELTDEYVVCSVELSDLHKNANGGIMGGVMFTLADFAFAVFANNLHMPTVAQQVSMNYLNAPKGKRLVAKAVCRKNGRQSSSSNLATL